MQPLIIVGASARAAAFSALRGGFQPYCADLFADIDLAARCEVRRVLRYPHGLIEAVAEFPSAPWIYTGGLENYPDLVDELAKSRTLLGNSGDVLRMVRDPAKITDALSGCSCRFPFWQPAADGLPTDGTWLRKGYRSAGGSVVHEWRGGGHEGGFRHYYQRRIEGRSAAAVYIAAAGRAVLIGLTEQLVGTAWTGAAAFHYAGSLAPLTLSAPDQCALAEMGDRLASVFGLQGLFGVDVLLADDGIYAVDVNPRFPASVEVLEHVYGFSAVGMHVEACRSGLLPAVPASNDGPFHGKAILFAPRRCTVGALFAERSQAAMRSEPWPEVADVPAEGSMIEAGRPVMTIFARAETWEALEHDLQAAVSRWRLLLERS
jgi:predicted ATP-grasp superfamily ATP-dependent carboligase